MTGWIIAAGIVLLLFILLACSVAVRFEYGEDIRLKISYLFITLVRVPQTKKKKTSRRKKRGKSSSKNKGKESSAEKAAEEPAKGSSGKSELAEDKSASAKIEKTAPDSKDKKDKGGNGGKEKDGKKDKGKDGKKKMSLGDILELVKLAVDSLGKPLKKLLHRTRILDFRLNIVCGGDDAAKAALNYGRMNIAVGAALGYIDTYFTLKDPSVSIGVDFHSEQTLTECSCTVKLSLLAALAFLFTTAGRALIYYLKNKRAAEAVGKLTAK